MTFLYFDIVLCLAALFLLCTFLTLKCRLHSALAPLCAVSLASVWSAAAGMLGALRAGTTAFYLAAAGLGAWALIDAARGVTAYEGHASIGRASAHGRWRVRGGCESKSAPELLFTPGAAVFWGMTVCFALYLGIRKPVFSDFDEFSLWGTAAKLMSTQNVLYTEGRIAWPWQGTQNCGLMCLSYFVQRFGQFAAWKTYLAYGMLLFACFAAVAGAAERRFASLVFPAAVLCWLSPWAFSVYARTTTVNHVYLSAYGDIPAGMVFGGAVVFWLGLRETKGPFWTLLPVLALAANIKSNTFVLSLAAAGIVAADVLFFPADGGAPWTKGLLRRAGRAAAAFAAPMLFYVCWNRYIAALVRRNAENNGMGETSEALATVAVNGIKMLLGLSVAPYYEERRARFAAAVSDMTTAFVSVKITMFGPGLWVVALLLVLTAGAVVLLPSAKRRVHAVVLTVLCAGCFLAYNFMLVLSYAFVFTEGQGAQLIDYNRYLYTYYIGWFLMVLALVCGAVRAAEGSILHWLGKAGVLVLACGFVFLSVRYLAPEMWLFGYDDSEYDGIRYYEAECDAAAAAIEADPERQGAVSEQRIFLVSQGDNGLRWFMFSYDFLPLVLDYSGFEAKDGLYGAGGGTFGLPELANGDVYYHAYSRADFKAAVLQSGCGYLFVEEIDDVFTQSYAPLFTDALDAAQRGAAVYRVTENGFVPVSAHSGEAAA